MRKKLHPEDQMTFVGQRTKGDCGVASLAGYLSLPYDEVAQVANKVVPSYNKTGMTTRNMLKIARVLGHPLKRLRKYSVLDAVGIADIDLTHKDNGHFALLNRGLVLDAFDSQARPVDVYLEQERATITALYVLETQ